MVLLWIAFAGLMPRSFHQLLKIERLCPVGVCCAIGAAATIVFIPLVTAAMVTAQAWRIG